MNKNIEYIKPAQAKSESFWIIIVTIIVLFLWLTGVQGRLRIENKKEIESWQLNVFTNLNSIEQGIYTDLKAAAEEIYQIHLDEGGKWYTVKDAQADYIAPFAQDITSRQRGNIEWQSKSKKTDSQDTVYYLGSSQNPKASGSFLLNIHLHANGYLDGKSYEMWYKTGKANWPDSLSDSFLIASNWKQLIAYQGEDEIKRLRGK